MKKLITIILLGTILLGCNVKFWVAEDSHYYWPVFLAPYLHQDLSMEVTFPEISWYSSSVQSGVNKLLMVGKLFHYAGYCTVGWQWTDAKPTDKPEDIFKGRCLRVYAFYHYNWDFPKWQEIGTIRVKETNRFDIIRTDSTTVWRMNGVEKYSIDKRIPGYIMRSPYFGGQGKSQYNHMIHIKW